MAPELIENPELVQNSFKINVYSYGMLLFNIITEIEPFEKYTLRDDLMKAVVNDERHEFTPSVYDEWNELILKYWDQDSNKRPSFHMILNDLSKSVNYHANKKTILQIE